MVKVVLIVASVAFFSGLAMLLRSVRGKRRTNSPKT